jgi:hypothetical protein
MKTPKTRPEILKEIRRLKKVVKDAEELCNKKKVGVNDKLASLIKFTNASSYITALKWALGEKEIL